MRGDLRYQQMSQMNEIENELKDDMLLHEGHVVQNELIVSTHSLSYADYLRLDVGIVQSLGPPIRRVTCWNQQEPEALFD